jgi:hypothetical protein
MAVYAGRTAQTAAGNEFFIQIPTNWPGLIHGWIWDHYGHRLARRARRLPFEETAMKKTLTGFLAVAAIAGTLAATVSDADAQWRRHGGGWGPGIGLGILGGAVIAGAILASRPPGYVVYRDYGQPVSRAGCYWASEPVYDRRGRVVGYTGDPVQVCP